MLSDLFTVFDYQSFVSSKSPSVVLLFWLMSLCFPVTMYSTGTWARGSALWSFLWRPLCSYIWGMSINSLGNLTKSGGALLVFSCFLWAVLMVLWQAVPGVFVSLPNLAVTGSVALPCWSAMVLGSILTSTNSVLSMMVPSGTPWGLVPALVTVEIFSHLFRPLALCARFSFSLMVGHIVLGLAWGGFSEAAFWLNPFFSESSFAQSVLIVFFNCALFFIEAGIGLLQAYIFFVLLLFFSTQYQLSH